MKKHKTTVQELEKRVKCVESGHCWEITGLYRGCSPYMMRPSWHLTVKCGTCGLIIDKFLSRDEHQLAASILWDCLSEIGKA